MESIKDQSNIGTMIFNRIIKIVKNRASGFRTLEAFTDLIFLTIGDVNIPEQIPMNFRTI